jgi:hypothetical protein
LIAPMRPERYLKMAAAMRRDGMSITVGPPGNRCPRRTSARRHGKILRSELQARVTG